MPVPTQGGNRKGTTQGGNRKGTEPHKEGIGREQSHTRREQEGNRATQGGNRKGTEPHKEAIGREQSHTRGSLFLIGQQEGIVRL